MKSVPLATQSFLPLECFHQTTHEALKLPQQQIEQALEEYLVKKRLIERAYSETEEDVADSTMLEETDTDSEEEVNLVVGNVVAAPEEAVVDGGPRRCYPEEGSD